MAKRRGERAEGGRSKKPEVVAEDALRKLAGIALDSASKETKIDCEDDEERAAVIDNMLGRSGDAIMVLLETQAECELEDLADADDEDED